MSVDVSVITPAFGRPDLLKVAIASVAESARHLSYEILVVDDCSPESLVFVKRWPNVKYERLAANRGSSAARNRGIEVATGRYLKFLDSDDVLLPDALVREVAAADAENADIVIGGWRETKLRNGPSEVVRVRSAPHFGDIADGLLAGYGVPVAAALYRRDGVLSVHWDEKLIEMNDWDYFVRCALCVKRIFTIDCLTFDWQSHTGPRITDYGVAAHTRAFYLILARLAASLEARQALTTARRVRLAQYLYKELRNLYVIDVGRGRAVFQRIYALDPRFSPRDEEPSRLFRAMRSRVLLQAALEAYAFSKRSLRAICAVFTSFRSTSRV